MVEAVRSQADYIRSVRAVGESLIKNAESIVGSEKYLMGLDISVYLGPGIGEEIPEINVTKRFLPEKFVGTQNDD